MEIFLDVTETLNPAVCFMAHERLTTFLLVMLLNANKT